MACSVRSEPSTVTAPGMTALNDSPRAVSSSPRSGRKRRQTVNVEVSSDGSRRKVVEPALAMGVATFD